MTNYFLSENATIMSFLPYSGGKFLSNCLSLSKNFCPQDPEVAKYLLEFPDDYDRRLETVMKTLPPSDRILDWRSYEYGDMQFYGRPFLLWGSGVAAAPIDLTKKLCDSNMRFFITDHTMTPVNLCRIWKKATIVRLVNFRKFRDLCLIKKTGSQPTNIDQIHADDGYYDLYKNFLPRSDWSTWEQFQRSGYDIDKCDILDREKIRKIDKLHDLQIIQRRVILYDVDQNYFDRNKFLTSVQNLYSNFGLSDFSYDLTGFFYDKYMSLHR